MRRKAIDYYDTFATNRGLLKKRILQVTGLSGVKELQIRMAERVNNKSVDVLVENTCSHNCIGCHFSENKGRGLVSVSSELIDDIRHAVDFVRSTNPMYVTFYPCEITTAMELLPIYTYLGSDRVLTNAKFLDCEGVIERLKRAGIRQMSITVPGEKEAYALYTGENPDTYVHLLSNISLAVVSGFDVSIFMPMFKGNLYDVRSTVDELYRRGIREIKFLRLLPVGKAKDLPDDMFLTNDEILLFLRTVNQLRHDYQGKGLRLVLFGGYFGPNFYSKNVFKYLQGENVPISNFRSRYFCPAIGQQFICLSVGSRELFGCHQGMSFHEFWIGSLKNDRFCIDANPFVSDDLKNNLRGLCSSDSCEEQSICMGGCRMVAFSNAKRRGENDPLCAGQDFCITHFLRSVSSF